jgi:hypothetical protein
MILLLLPLTLDIAMRTMAVSPILTAVVDAVGIGAGTGVIPGVLRSLGLVRLLEGGLFVGDYSKEGHSELRECY